MTAKLPLIGRDLVTIKNLAKEIRGAPGRGEITELYGTADKRGFYFRVRVAGKDGKPTGHIARVEVTLDEVYIPSAEGSQS
jgi:hypothetical protein